MRDSSYSISFHPTYTNTNTNTTTSTTTQLDSYYDPLVLPAANVMFLLLILWRPAEITAVLLLWIYIDAIARRCLLVLYYIILPISLIFTTTITALLSLHLFFNLFLSLLHIFRALATVPLPNYPHTALNVTF